MNTGLAEYFFGRGLDQKLTFQRFLTFQRQLQHEILSIEVRYSTEVILGFITVLRSWWVLPVCLPILYGSKINKYRKARFDVNFSRGRSTSF